MWDEGKYSYFAQMVERQSLVELARRHNTDVQSLVNLLGWGVGNTYAGIFRPSGLAKWASSQGVHIDEMKADLFKRAESTQGDPSAFLSDSHRAARFIVGEALGDYEVHAPNSRDYRTSLDQQRIQRLYRNLLPNSPALDIHEMAVRVLSACDTVFPLLGGFNASIRRAIDDSAVPTLSIFNGVFECCFTLGPLLIHYTTDSQGEWGVESRRPDGKVQADAFADIQTVIAIATGQILSGEFCSDHRTELNACREMMAHYMTSAAQHFVIIHEFAHLLLHDQRDSALNELSCDEFSARICLAILNGMRETDPVLRAVGACGVCMALLLVMLFSPSPHSAKVSTHPPPETRIGRIYDQLQTDPILSKSGAGGRLGFHVLTTLLQYVQSRTQT